MTISPSNPRTRNRPASSGEGMAAKRPPRRMSWGATPLTNVGPATSTDAVEIAPGTMIGDYRVRRRLDEGGMGTVYLAIHPVIGKNVAVKVLHPHVARQEEAVARFIQEARAVNAIGHPGIVDIFGFGRFVDGRHYFIMEYLEGEQLLNYLNTRGPIPGAAALPVMRQIAASLSAAHAKGVVHRDMKPENVFLCPIEGQKWPPRVKILDFGLAKLIEAGLGGKPRTRAGVTVGTPYYMAPEQCRGKLVDRRADVYALGVMMYEITTGRVPFYAPDSVDVLYMHLSQDPEPPSRHRPVPSELEELILRCMAKKPEERPDSMEALIQAIDGVSAALSPNTDNRDTRPEEELVREAAEFFGSGVADAMGTEDRPPTDPRQKTTTRPFGKKELDQLRSKTANEVPATGAAPVPGLPGLGGEPEPEVPARATSERAAPAVADVPRLPSVDDGPRVTTLEDEAPPAALTGQAPAAGMVTAAPPRGMVPPLPMPIDDETERVVVRPRRAETEMVEPPQQIVVKIPLALWIVIGMQTLIILVLAALLLK